MTKKKLIIGLLVIIIFFGIFFSFKRSQINQFSTLEEESNQINSIIYSVIAFSTLLLLSILFFSMSLKKPLIKQADELLRKKRVRNKLIETDSPKTIPEINSTIPNDPDIKEEITKEEESEPDNEVFKKDEEKLVEEMKKEIEKKNINKIEGFINKKNLI